MRKKYVLLLLIFFGMHIFSVKNNEEESPRELTARGAALMDRFREKPYAELEKELQQCKNELGILNKRYTDTLKTLLEKKEECDQHIVHSKNYLATLKQRTALLEHQLMHAHSFEGWLSHRITLVACAGVILPAAYKKYAMPRLQAWAQKIRNPTWKKKVLQLLAGDWWKRVWLVRRRGKKGNA